MTNKKIAIIGGGLSGLSSAYFLSQKGYAVTVFEKEGFLGGELATINIGGKWPVEKYYHHIFSANTETVKLFSELELERKLKWHKSKIGIVKQSTFYAFTTPMDLLKIPFVSFWTRLRLGLGSVLFKYLPSFHLVQNKTAKELIIRLMGQSAWFDFWQPMFKLKFGQFSEQISAVWFWSRLRERLSNRKNGEKLGYPDGGFKLLLNALSKKIQKNHGLIITGKLITKIVQKNKEFMINRKTFDGVISTVSLPVFLEIAPGKAVEKRKLSQIKHLAVLTVLLELDRPATDFYWTNVLDPNLPFVVMIEQTNLIKKNHYGKNLLYLGRYLDSGSELYQKSDQEIAKIFLDGLYRICPKTRGSVKKYHLFRDNHAQPVIEKNYQKPDHKTGLTGLYFSTAAHIYPRDRGIEGTIAEAKKMTRLISAEI